MKAVLGPAHGSSWSLSMGPRCCGESIIARETCRPMVYDMDTGYDARPIAAIATRALCLPGRYPRSARRAVTSFARRNAHASGSAGGGLPAGTGDASLFPVHAGQLARIIADLLSLPPPAQPSAAHGGDKHSHSHSHSHSQSHSHSPRPSIRKGPSWSKGESVFDPGETSGKEDGSEPSDICAERLARLPVWKLLDSPHAFHEVFSCAVLVMEALQAQGPRGHHPPRVG